MFAVRLLIAFLLAVATTVVLASIFQTLSVEAALSGAGAEFDLPTRIDMAASDFIGLAPSFAPVVAGGLAVAFVVASILKRFLKPLAPVAYPLAGAAAIGAALLAMPVMLDLQGITPLAGSRGALGFALQCLAGAAGGLVFATAGPKRS